MISFDHSELRLELNEKKCTLSMRRIFCSLAKNNFSGEDGKMKSSSDNCWSWRRRDSWKKDR